jgi:DNA-binding winged helix-turn-helix (wHTH) protein
MDNGDGGKGLVLRAANGGLNSENNGSARTGVRIDEHDRSRNVSNHLVYRIADIELDPYQFALLRNGVARPIEPKVLELIVFLIIQRPRMVPREEVMSQLWRGHFVSASVLTRAVCLARKALGNQQSIRTIHARGYQWVASVIVTEHDGDCNTVRVLDGAVGARRADLGRPVIDP